PGTFSPREKGGLPSPPGRGVGGEGRLRARRQSAREASGIVGALRAVTTKGLEPDCKIDGIASKATFREHDGDFARGSCFPFAGGVDHHARKPRRQREAGDCAALVGDASVAVDGADLSQERASLLERGARRRIEKGELR